MTNVALLVNPTAGRGRAARLVEPITDRLRRGGADVEVVQGNDAAEAARRGRDAVVRGATTVVAVGGDGLVNLAVQLAAGTSTTLGIVPAGTGNDIARALGLDPEDPVEAVDVVLRGQVRRIDLGRAPGRWFAGVLSAGFDSAVNERANRMRWPMGRSRYNLAIAAELRRFTPLPFVLELDGQRLETEAMLVAVANAPSYGGGIRVCPDAQLDDGWLDVLVVGPVSKLEFVRVFPRVYAGTHVTHPAVTVHRARRVSLTAAAVTAYADGERLGPLPVSCELVAEALSVLAP